MTNQKSHTSSDLWSRHNTPGSLLLRQDPEGHIHNSDLFNLIPCELDLTSTPFRDETIITYDIELPPSRNKIGFNLMGDEYFTTPYITLSQIRQMVVNFHHKLREMCGS